MVCSVVSLDVSMYTWSCLIHALSVAMLLPVAMDSY